MEGQSSLEEILSVTHTEDVTTGSGPTVRPTRSGVAA